MHQARGVMLSGAANSVIILPPRNSSPQAHHEKSNYAFCNARQPLIFIKVGVQREVRGALEPKLVFALARTVFVLGKKIRSKSHRILGVWEKTAALYQIRQCKTVCIFRISGAEVKTSESGRDFAA